MRQRFYWLLSMLFLISLQAFSQTGQLTVSKVASMPANLPSPYLMRNWKQVAVRYDSTIYNGTATGQYLPFLHLLSAGVNYPSVSPILIPSYVGGDQNQGEGINIIPSIVGATLNGVDKSNQNGVNWVEKAKDFFNKKNGENVYLNNYSTGTGGDWWYELMPNVFFYQMYSQYPNTTDFKTQFTAIADRELGVVKALGGTTTPFTVPNFNYRAFDLLTNTPLATGVTEPEAAGTVAWLLYHAYLKTGETKYLDGAKLAITFLSNLTFNPAYELELPYGSFIAAKMNAELGTNYNIQKMVNWSFDQSSKRNWGTIVGTWGDGTTGMTDVSGLVGEVDNPSTGYGFALNGFQQASALVPMVKYDKRFARDIAKWALNLANASRLYYSQYLPSTHQDDFAWTSVHDPAANIGYESLKQNRNGVLLYATGDAKAGGGATNLGLYGSSSVGYLGAIVNTTDVDGILALDVNKTDFFGQNAFPSYLVYNPNTALKTVTLTLPAGTFDIYDAITETTLKTGVSGSFSIDIPTVEVRMLVYLPTGTTTAAVAGKLMAGTKVVDYHYGYNFTPKMNIRSLGTADTTVGFGNAVKVYSSVISKPSAATFNWYAHGALITSSADSTLNWTVPSIAGPTWLVLKVTAGAQTAVDSIQFNVFDHVPNPPAVTGIVADSLYYLQGTIATFICKVAATETGPLTYTWSLPGSGGPIVKQKDSLMVYTVPGGEGLYSISCKVTNADNLSTTVSYNFLVKNPTTGTTAPVAYYPLNGDAKDVTGNGHDGTVTGATPTTDVRGTANAAYKFAFTPDIIDVPNAPSLNFQNQITLSFWVNLTQVPNEVFILSHGSYEQRWKVSIIPTRYLRWTLRTTAGNVLDLDSSFPFALNTFYHCTVVYSGYSMEIYINGLLDRVVPMSGFLPAATVDLTMGRKDPTTQDYHLYGTLDEVRIYDKALNPDEIITLKTIFGAVTGLGENLAVEVYPNPASGVINITGLSKQDAKVRLMDITGKPINTSQAYFNDRLRVEYSQSSPGILLLKIETQSGIIWKKIISN